MAWLSKHLTSCMMAAVGVCAVSAGAVKAEATTYDCKGVDYLYEGGIGNKSRRVSANRTFILDTEAMTAELKDDDGSHRTQLEIDVGAYQGFIPGKTEVSGTPVRGVVFAYHPKFNSLELRYELEDGRHFLLFTGHCR